MPLRPPDRKPARRRAKRRNPLHTRVRDLPASLQAALRDVGYGKAAIELRGSDTFTYQQIADDGEKAFTMVVNMATGDNLVEWGTWGSGSGTNRVDADRSRHPIPVNGAVVQGVTGRGHPVYATITVHPSNLTTMLQAPVELSPQTQLALDIVGGYTSKGRIDEFEYRKLGKYGPANPLVQELAAKGLVKITASGVQVTTEGKSARRRNPGRRAVKRANPDLSGARAEAGRIARDFGQRVGIWRTLEGDYRALPPGNRPATMWRKIEDWPRANPARRNSGAPPFASTEEYEDWKRQARAAQMARAHTAAGRLAVQHGGEPEESGEMSYGWQSGHTPDGRSLGQHVHFGKAQWRVADLPQRLYFHASSHEGMEAIAAYILDHRVPPIRGNPKKPTRRIPKKPMRRNPLPAVAVTAAMTLLPYVVSALGQKLSAFNALPRAARKVRLLAILNSRWLYAIPAVLPIARLAAKSAVAVDALLDALAGHGQVAVRAGGAAAQAALAKRTNPEAAIEFGALGPWGLAERRLRRNLAGLRAGDKIRLQAGTVRAIFIVGNVADQRIELRGARGGVAWITWAEPGRGVWFRRSGATQGTQVDSVEAAQAALAKQAP